MEDASELWVKTWRRKITLPNQPWPISFKYRRLWRPTSEDFSSWTGKDREAGLEEKDQQTRQTD